eukprot:SAG22_NODE_11183_length_496_cov_3.166247_1_plen_63_part_10
MLRLESRLFALLTAANRLGRTEHLLRFAFRMVAWSQLSLRRTYRLFVNMVRFCFPLSPAFPCG